MIDILRQISSLRRPRLLIRAARIGVAEYRRERDLTRLMKRADLPCPQNALTSLLDEELQLEEIRKRGDGSYSPMRHVEVLIALMAEARLLPQAVSEIR
jgi:hypothetical protein